MSRPGDRLRAVAARLFAPATMERLIDPVIADFQCEHAEAVRLGRRWRARWVRAASFIAVCKVAGLAVFAPNSHGARAIAVALTAGTVVTALGIGAALAGTAATIHTRGNMVRLVLYLVPQALTISLPVCIALGLFIWIRAEGAAPATSRTVVRMMRVALLLAIVNVGWITPAANTAYRNVVAGNAVFRGPNELTFIELGRRMYNRSPDRTLEGPLPLAFAMNARLAVAIAPVLLSVLALAGATRVRRRPAAAVVFATLAMFVGCYVLVPDSDVAFLMQWLPAAVVAWLPNAIVMTAIVSMVANGSSSRASGAR
jgi:hypothetical protein